MRDRIRNASITITELPRLAVGLVGLWVYRALWLRDGEY